MNRESELTLWFDSIKVGNIRGAFTSDQTWYGTLENIVDPANSALARRVVDYIEFCEEFYEGDPSSEDAPDPVTEFGRFSDVVDSGRWHVETSAGEKRSILFAVTFFKGGEITWREI